MMKRALSWMLLTGLTGGALVLGVQTVRAEGETQAGAKPEAPAEATSADAATPPAEEASAQNTQGKEMAGLAQSFARELSVVMNAWIDKKEIEPEKLNSFLYYPEDRSTPTRYQTHYNALAERDFPAIQERYLQKNAQIVFAITVDRNGYCPVHNRLYNQPLTGNNAVDWINNRGRRFFAGATGFKDARNVKPVLFQVYPRDTGELLGDVSAPIYVKGQHWGAARIAYRFAEK